MKGTSDCFQKWETVSRANAPGTKSPEGKGNLANQPLSHYIKTVVGLKSGRRDQTLEVEGERQKRLHALRQEGKRKTKWGEGPPIGCRGGRSISFSDTGKRARTRPRPYSLGLEKKKRNGKFVAAGISPKEEERGPAQLRLLCGKRHSGGESNLKKNKVPLEKTTLTPTGHETSKSSWGNKTEENSVGGRTRGHPGSTEFSTTMECHRHHTSVHGKWPAHQTGKETSHPGRGWAKPGRMEPPNGDSPGGKCGGAKVSRPMTCGRRALVHENRFQKRKSESFPPVWPVEATDWDSWPLQGLTKKKHTKTWAPDKRPLRWGS